MVPSPQCYRIAIACPIWKRRGKSRRIRRCSADCCSGGQAIAMVIAVVVPAQLAAAAESRPLAIESRAHSRQSPLLCATQRRNDVEGIHVPQGWVDLAGLRCGRECLQEDDDDDEKKAARSKVENLRRHTQTPRALAGLARCEASKVRPVKIHSGGCFGNRHADRNVGTRINEAWRRWQTSFPSVTDGWTARAYRAFDERQFFVCHCFCLFTSHVHFPCSLRQTVMVRTHGSLTRDEEINEASWVAARGAAAGAAKACKTRAWH